MWLNIKNKNKNMQKQKITNREKIVLLLTAIIYIYMFALTPSLLNRFSYMFESTHAVTTERVADEVVPTAKVYAYNDQVPVEVVKAEIIRQAKEFGLGENFMLNLAFAESGYNNLADNKKSSALGVFQYLDGTWRETESWKNHHISRTDYKANIREACIDISNGEHFRWSESLD